MKRLILVIIVISAIACQNQGSEKSIEEVNAKGKISELIRNPASANEPTDTINVAKIIFEEAEFDFGEVNEGDKVTHVYNFINTGKVPLLISNARSTCGCTVPVWPKDPIPPGLGGEISVKFDTKNKKNRQSKPVTITANTYPSQTKVFLKGYVKPAAIEE